MSDTKILHWKTALYRQATIKNRRAVAVPIRLKWQISQKSALYRQATIKNRRAVAVPIRLKRQISRKSTLYRLEKIKKNRRSWRRMIGSSRRREIVVMRQKASPSAIWRGQYMEQSK